MWTVRLYHFSPHYLIKVTIFEKKKYIYILNKKYAFLLYADLSEIFLIIRRNERYIIISVLRSSNELPVILVRF